MAGIWGKSVKNMGARFSRFPQYFGSGSNVHHDIRVPWVLEHRIIDNAPNDANYKQGSKSSCCHCWYWECLSQMTFKHLEGFIVRWFHIYQCLSMSEWIKLFKFIFYILQHKLSILVGLGFSLFSKTHAHSCFYTFASCCLPFLLALLFLPQWSLGYGRQGKKLGINLLFLLSQIKVRKNCVHVWGLEVRAGFCVYSFYLIYVYVYMYVCVFIICVFLNVHKEDLVLFLARTTAPRRMLGTWY